MDIGTLPTRNARHYANREALLFEGQRYTWRDINTRINRTANALIQLGVGKGDTVALFLPNCRELVDLYWGIAKVGAVAVPLSPLLRGPGLAALVRDSNAVAVVTCRDVAAEIERIRPDLPAISPGRLIVTDDADRPGFTDYSTWVGAASTSEPPPSGVLPSDPYNIMYSSGTTGEPKGIVHSHEIRGHYPLVFDGPFRIDGDAVILQSGSLVFNGSMLMFIPWMYNAARMVLLRKFDPAVCLETIRTERITHGMMVPSQLVAMMERPEFTGDVLASLTTVVVAGAPLLLEHKQRLNRIRPGAWCELYGLTEGGCATILERSDFLRKPASVGTPVPFCQMKVVDEEGRELPAGHTGEILGRGTLMMAGYYKRPDLTAQAIRDGWLHTGDMGYFDDEGFLYLVDRKKDMIISGGVNVYPKDIEEIVARHPAIREAAVFGIPDPKWGEVVHAAIVLKAGETIAADEIITWVNERVAAKYQRIHSVSLRDEFPRNAAGKTLKREMRAPFWANRTTAI